MTKYAIRKVPACQDWKGQFYPEHFQLVVYCSRGLAWDGGEFQTREEAVLIGESK